LRDRFRDAGHTASNGSRAAVEPLYGEVVYGGFSLAFPSVL
jgi:hypothetical protein